MVIPLLPSIPTYKEMANEQGIKHFGVELIVFSPDYSSNSQRIVQE